MKIIQQKTLHNGKPRCKYCMFHMNLYNECPVFWEYINQMEYKKYIPVYERVGNLIKNIKICVDENGCVYFKEKILNEF